MLLLRFSWLNRSLLLIINVRCTDVLVEDVVIAPENNLILAESRLDK